MELFRRRQATSEELKQGRKEIEEAQRRLEREVGEGARGLALEDDVVEEGRVVGVGSLPKEKEGGEGPAIQSVNPQQFSIATSPNPTEPKEPERLGARSPQAQAKEREAGEGKADRAEGFELAGTPVVYGPNGMGFTASGEEPQLRSAESEERRMPLFDEQQLFRLQQLQSQAAWMYDSQKGYGFVPPVARPLFLEREEDMRRVVEEERKKLEEKIREQERQKKEREEVEKMNMIRTMEAMMNENNQLKQRLKKIEEEQVRFSTPESGKAQSPRGEKTFWEGGERERVVAREETGERRSEGERPKEDEKTAFKVMLKLMEGMQAMQKQWLEEKESFGGAEVVRGTPQLPPLADWSATTGPIDLNDWLALIEPMMADLTNTSGDWWRQLMAEASDWYLKHLQLQPLDRINHEPKPSEELSKAKWSRLERRASTMLLMALPEGQREELISSKRLTAMKIICQLLTAYQPGGLAEKELILRQLESPAESQTLSEAVQSLRRWIG